MSLFKPRYRSSPNMNPNTSRPHDEHEELTQSQFAQDRYAPPLPPQQPTHSPSQPYLQPRYPRYNQVGGVQVPSRQVPQEPSYDYDLQYGQQRQQQEYYSEQNYGHPQPLQSGFRSQERTQHEPQYDYAGFPLRQQSQEHPYFTSDARAAPQLRMQTPFTPLQRNPGRDGQQRSIMAPEQRFFTAKEKYDEGRQAPTRFVLVIAAIIILCAASWFMYRWLSAPRGQQIPTYAADAGPFKVRPDDPGGMRIPHQEKTVYDRFEPNQNHPRQEQLLPEPEKPISPPDLYYPPSQQQVIQQPQQSGGPSQQQPPLRPSVPLMPPAPDYNPDIAYNPDGTPQQSVQDPQQGAILVENETAETTDAAPHERPRSDLDTVEIPKLTTRKHRLQIASLESREEALSEMIRYKDELADIFKGKTVTIQKSGKYWRILAGPYNDHNAAKAAQTKLRKEGQEANIIVPAS